MCVCRHETGELETALDFDFGRRWRLQAWRVFVNVLTLETPESILATIAAQGPQLE
jgi:hypothetical protein